MKELAFPLLGVLVVFGLVVPMATLVAKGGLALLRRRGEPLERSGSGVAYVLIVAPVIGPIAWFTSAGLHQSEPGGAVEACLYDHFGSGTCHDALLFVGAIALLVAAAFWLNIRALGAHRETRRLDGSSHGARLRRLCQGDRRLRRLRARVVDEHRDLLCTSGLWRPEVIVHRSLLERLDDAALRGALLHEAAHVAGRDPLRYLVARVCLSLNPLGPLLRGDYVRWRTAREVVCDTTAVRFGASPLDLADALVATARLGGGPHTCQALLGPQSLSTLKIRVHRLLELAAEPAPANRPPAAALGAGVVVAAAVMLPHWFGSAPLDHLHSQIERLLSASGLF